MIIQIKGLYKSYKANHVLKGIDLEFEQGRIYAVLGPNGSGKTTLIKSILGMVIPQSGDISVQGEPIKNDWTYRKHIDYLPQIANFPSNLRVRELIDMIRDIRGGTTREKEFIDRFGLSPYMKQRLGSLSGGTKQKVNLTLAFMFDSPLIVLDEPNTGLDPASVIALKDLIKKEQENGKTLIITSHVMQFVEEVAQEVVYLLEGVIHFKGTLEQLKESTGRQNVEHAIARIIETTNHA